MTDRALAGAGGCEGNGQLVLDADLSKKFSFHERSNGSELPISKRKEEILDLIGGKSLVMRLAWPLQMNDVFL